MLKPFFTYFGGKWRAAPHYPKPTYNTLIEPFAGAAGYSLRYPERQVQLFDADPIIYGIWNYLITTRESEIRSLPLEITDVRSMGLPQEAQWLIGFWLNKGSAAPCRTPGAWMRGGTRPKSYWGEVIRDRIASQQQYIRHWTVSNTSYEKIGNLYASWFIDPPYHKSGFAYRHSAVDYTHLANWCKSRFGQIIVCEQAGASWLPFEPFRTIKSLSSSRGSKQSVEVIWTSNL